MFYVCVSEDTSILVRDVRYCCNSPCLDWSVLSDLSTQVECLDEITSFFGDVVGQVRKTCSTCVAKRFGAARTDLVQFPSAVRIIFIYPHASHLNLLV